MRRFRDDVVAVRSLASRRSSPARNSRRRQDSSHPQLLRPSSQLPRVSFDPRPNCALFPLKPSLDFLRRVRRIFHAPAFDGFRQAEVLTRHVSTTQESSRLESRAGPAFKEVNTCTF